MTKETEKRKYRRVREELDIKIKTEKKGELIYKLKVGKSRNLSACGVLIRYDRNLHLGEIVKVTFLKPNSFDFFEAYAMVVRTELNPDDETYDIGVAFINLSEAEEKTLDRCLSKIKV